jgi:hypothetical protein
MTAHYPDAEERRRTVLVAVINNAADLRRAADEGWYRIPQRRAPRRIGADFLAFYLTAGCGDVDLAHKVPYFAPTRRYQLLTRAELLPEECTHPRAHDYYYRVEIGPLQQLEHPVSAHSYHRVTFIHTTLERLLAAEDVLDLFRRSDPFEQLWGALREHNLRPLKNRLVGDCMIDITLRARGGYLGINCVEDATAQEHRLPLQPHRWSLLNLATEQIEQDLSGCLRQIGAALIELGGSVLNVPALDVEQPMDHLR